MNENKTIDDKAIDEKIAEDKIIEENKIENSETATEEIDIDVLMKKARHKAEVPLGILAIILNLYILYLLAKYFILLRSGNGIISDVASWWIDLDSTEVEILTDSEIFCIPVLFTIIVIKMFFKIKTLYHNCYAKGVRVGVNQFPKIYEIEERLGKRFKLKRVPKVFINSDTSEIKIMGVAIKSATFVSIAPGVALYNPDITEFIIAREFAHVYYGHYSIPLYLLNFCAYVVPFFGKAYSRCMEYSADRAAQYILGDETAKQCIVKSSVHYLLANKMDKESYLNHITQKCGLEASIYYFWLNLVSTVPINRFRIKAIYDPKKKSGRLF